MAPPRTLGLNHRARRSPVYDNRPARSSAFSASVPSRRSSRTLRHNFSVSSSRASRRAVANSSTSAASQGSDPTSRCHIVRDRSSCRARRLVKQRPQMAPPSLASTTCDANSRNASAASGWMFRSTKRAVLVSISIDAAALIAPASLRSSATRSAIIAAPSSVHDRAGIELDDLGRIPARAASR